jgi:hypothetical protein
VPPRGQAAAADPPDASALASPQSPPVGVATARGVGPANAAALGWTARALDPDRPDPRRRVPATARPAAFGHTLQPGERFKFDVTFAGNPAGLAEAEVVAVEADPRGDPPAGAPVIRLRGHARTSGIVSLVATITDDITTLVDAKSGATVFSENVLVYAGWSPVGYKRRVTTATYEGRGHVRIEDVKDGQSRKVLKRPPLDTFDPLSAMAWVRSLPLDQPMQAKAHAIDGTTLLRIEVVSHGRQKLSPMPSIGRALGLRDEDAVRIEGQLTRVDAYDQPIPGKRTYELRAWLSADERRIPLVIESDMWVSALRLELASYDPPPPRPSAEPQTRAPRERARPSRPPA